MKSKLFIAIIILLMINTHSKLCAQPLRNLTADSTYTKTVEPSFPGGVEELHNYLHKELKYPKSAIQYGPEGRVIVKFTVKKNCKLTNFNIIKGLFPDCDDEAIYLIKTMPKWIPGMRNGAKCDMDVIVPIEFKAPN